MVALFRCERMNANISRRQCEINRKGVKTYGIEKPACFSCTGCPGLGAAVVKNETREVTVMENKTEELKPKKVKRAYCKHPGCRKYPIRNGLCTAHLRKAGLDPKTGKPADTDKQDVGERETEKNVVQVDLNDMLVEVCDQLLERAKAAVRMEPDDWAKMLRTVMLCSQIKSTVKQTEGQFKAEEGE